MSCTNCDAAAIGLKKKGKRWRAYFVDYPTQEAEGATKEEAAGKLFLKYMSFFGAIRM